MDSFDKNAPPSVADAPHPDKASVQGTGEKTKGGISDFVQKNGRMILGALTVVRLLTGAGDLKIDLSKIEADIEPMTQIEQINDAFTEFQDVVADDDLAAALEKSNQENDSGDTVHDAPQTSAHGDPPDGYDEAVDKLSTDLQVELGDTSALHSSTDSDEHGKPLETNSANELSGNDKTGNSIQDELGERKTPEQMIFPDYNDAKFSNVPGSKVDDSSALHPSTDPNERGKSLETNPANELSGNDKTGNSIQDELGEKKTPEQMIIPGYNDAKFSKVPGSKVDDSSALHPSKNPDEQGKSLETDPVKELATNDKTGDKTGEKTPPVDNKPMIDNKPPANHDGRDLRIS